MKWAVISIFAGVFLAVFLTLFSTEKYTKKVGIENTVLVAERIARVGFVNVENESQVQYFDPTGDYLSPFDDNDPEFNPGSTPNEWRSGSTPNEWRSGSTPNEWRSGSTPNEWRSGSTPSEWRSGSTPNEWRSGSTPNEWRSGSAPNVPSQVSPESPSDGNEEWFLSGRKAFPLPQVRFQNISN